MYGLGGPHFRYRCAAFKDVYISASLMITNFLSSVSSGAAISSAKNSHTHIFEGWVLYSLLLCCFAALLDHSLSKSCTYPTGMALPRTPARCCTDDFYFLYSLSD